MSFSYEGTPRRDNILVSPVESEHSSQLIIPKNMKSRTNIGYVKSVGPDVKDIKAGDLVLYDAFASYGAEISLMTDGEETRFMLLKDYDIQLTLKKVEIL